MQGYAALRLSSPALFATLQDEYFRREGGDAAFPPEKFAKMVGYSAVTGDITPAFLHKVASKLDLLFCTGIS
jgi:hypothetical protein